MICDKKSCTGCYACVNICPKDCIAMEKDENGVMYPQIDSKVCIDCGQCSRVCPALKPLEIKTPMLTYAAYAKDEGEHKASTSGGLATLFARRAIQNGGVAFGAAMDGIECHHIVVENEADLERLRGSKYVHSHIEYIFKAVKKAVEANREAVFVGTPCQVAGLRNYLKRDYDNLLLIDLICHGTPPQEFFKEYMKYEFGNIPIEKCSFRSAEGLQMTVVENSGVKHSWKYSRSIYYDAFLKSWIYRQNCYSCPYANEKRVGDITLGDFWGLGDSIAFEGNNSNGINVALINTERGRQAFEGASASMDCWQRELKEAVAGNPQLRRPAIKSEVTNKFYANVGKMGFVKAYKKANPKRYALVKLRGVCAKNKVIHKLVSKIPVLNKKLL